MFFPFLPTSLEITYLKKKIKNPCCISLDFAKRVCPTIFLRHGVSSSELLRREPSWTAGGCRHRGCHVLQSGPLAPAQSLLQYLQAECSVCEHGQLGLSRGWDLKEALPLGHHLMSRKDTRDLGGGQRGRERGNFRFGPYTLSSLPSSSPLASHSIFQLLR